MCTNNNGALVPFALKVPAPGSPFAAYHPSMTQAAFEFHRAQLYDYNARLHYGLARAYPAHGLSMSPYHHNPHDPLTHPFFQAKYDPRARLVHEEPKPQHSYIGLIAMAILSVKDKKLVLSDIYQWILDNYVYFRCRGPGWRNSIRHNLSLNDCFIKSGRSANGKGHYWAIHPANVEDFKKGDFRRRKAQRRVRKHMGLAIPDDEDSPSPPPPVNVGETADWQAKVIGSEGESLVEPKPSSPGEDGLSSRRTGSPEGHPHMGNNISPGLIRNAPSSAGKKRLFDVESLLAPDDGSKFSATQSDNAHINVETDSHLNEDSDDELIDVDSKVEVDDHILRPGPSQHEAASPEGSDQREASEGRERDFVSRSGSPCSPTERPVGSPSPGRSETAGSSGNMSREGSASWSRPLSVGTTWPDHPSAFHSATPSTVTAWSTIPPHGFPIMSAPFPLPAHGASAAEALAAQQRWQETFNRIMARSYDKNLKLEA